MITMRLVYDYYVIQIPCLSLYPFGNPSDNRVVTIATVFPVNPVFDFTNTGNTGFTVSVILV